MASGAHVRLDGVRKLYGRVAALNGLDLDLEPGITGLLGPNGAGKTSNAEPLSPTVGPRAGWLLPMTAAALLIRRVVRHGWALSPGSEAVCDAR